MVYATIRQHGDAVTTEKTTEKDEGVNAPNGPVSGTLNDTLNGILNGTLNDRQKEVLNYITAIPGVQARVIIDKLLIPRDTLNEILKVLMDRGLIERRGSKKTGGYYPVTKK